MSFARAAPILQRLQQVSGGGFQFSGFWGSLLEAVLNLGISRKEKGEGGGNQVLQVGGDKGRGSGPAPCH